MPKVCPSGLLMFAATLVYTANGYAEQQDALAVTIEPEYVQVTGGPARADRPLVLCFNLEISNNTDDAYSYEVEAFRLEVPDERLKPLLKGEIPRFSRVHVFPSQKNRHANLLLERLPRLESGTLAPGVSVSGWMAFKIPLSQSTVVGAEPLLEECVLRIPVGSTLRRIDLMEKSPVRFRPSRYDSSIQVLEVSSVLNGLNVHQLISAYDVAREVDEDFIVEFSAKAMLIDDQIAQRLRSVDGITRWARKRAFWSSVPGNSFSRVHSQLIQGTFRGMESEARAVCHLLSAKDKGGNLLVEKLAHPAAELRAEITEQLSQHIHEPGVVQALESALDDSDERVCGNALYSLATYYRSVSEDARLLAEDLLGRVIDISVGDSPPLRIGALYLLGVTRNPRGQAEVIRSASDSNANVRRAAIQAMRSIDLPEATAIVLRAFDDEDMATRTAAVYSAAAHPSELVGDSIVRMLDTDDVSQQLAACRSLKELRYRPSIPKLRGLLLHKNFGIARHASDALVAMEALSDDEVIRLKRMWGDPTPPPSAKEIARRLSTEQQFISPPITNSIGMVFVPIPAGEFQMGNRKVTISKPFYISSFEVTQDQFARLMQGSGRPKMPIWRGYVGKQKAMTMVTFGGAVEFCEKLCEESDESSLGRVYRLPTEAEWEFACRAGSPSKYCFGNDVSRIDGYAWHSHNSGRRIQLVGQKMPNRWGLYDMYGNVSEWCSDWYAEYPPGDVTDPTGPTSGSSRVVRGGSCTHPGSACTSAGRDSMSPDSHGDTRGFRVVLQIPPDAANKSK